MGKTAYAPGRWKVKGYTLEARSDLELDWRVEAEDELWLRVGIPRALARLLGWQGRKLPALRITFELDNERKHGGRGKRGPRKATGEPQKPKRVTSRAIESKPGGQS